MKSSSLFALAAAVGCVSGSIQGRDGNWTVGQTVQTSSGPVSGHAATNDSQVSEYLGIPYGVAPVGTLRFAAPIKFNGTQALNGSSFVRLGIAQSLELANSREGIFLSC